MNARQENLLLSIVLEHIRTNLMVPSQRLSMRFLLSPATIRHEMTILAQEGYISQPYTSSGRIPTEKGYRFYIEHFLENAKISSRDQSVLLQILCNPQEQQPLKKLAKAISETLEETVFLSMGKYDMYLTGLSCLLAQPEFSLPSAALTLCKMMDSLEKVIAQLFDDVEGLRIYIGSDNPFGADCGTLLLKPIETRQPCLFGILGPLRMDYRRNVSVLRYAEELLQGKNLIPVENMLS